MSWFDDLFSNKDNSDDELLRRKSKRRNGDLTQSKDDSLLPENNDIYDRPKGKFRFPIDVGRDETYEEATYRESNDDKENHSTLKDNQYGSYEYDDYTGHMNSYSDDDRAENARRHRRRKHVSQDDSGMSSIKSRTSQTSSRTHNTSTSQRFNKRQNTHSRTNNANYRSANSNQSRMKLQSERFKSNYHLSSEPTYHRSSFKTSEVPSAIFGTKKRRPIENGVIPPVKDDTDTSESKTKHHSSTVEHVPHESKNEKDSIQKFDGEHLTSQENAPVNSEQQSVVEGNADTSNHYERTPNYSKRDNTVNIENIYASQIVEEIRKERERKVQQKRKFKQALQNKRQQTDEEDSIQRAIDEMYAKQAEQYIGESSLNQSDHLHSDVTEGVNDEYKNNNDHVESQAQVEDVVHHETSNAQSKDDSDIDHNIEQQEYIEESNAPYNYEEIDLNQVSSVQEVNQDDVQVKDVPNDQLSNANHDEAQRHSNEAIDESTKESNYHHEVADEEAVQLQSNNDDSDSLSENIHDDNHNGTVDDAQFREIDDVEPHTDIMSENESLSDGTSAIEDDEDVSTENVNHAIKNAVTSEVEYATKEDDETNGVSQNTNIEGQNVSQSTKTHNEPSNKMDDSFAVKDTDESVQGLEDEHINNGDDKSEITHKEAKKVPEKMSITPGSKPFNVVMTPSDKKRMMDAKKESVSKHKVNVPELKPETKQHIQTKKRESEINHHTNESRDNENTLSESQTESTHSNYHINHSDEQDKNLNNDINRDDDNLVEEPLENSQNTDTDSEEQSNQAVHSNHDMNNHQEVNPTVSADDQTIVSSNHHQKEDHNAKGTIRRGPNIKLPSLDLLEDHEAHEIDEAWIEEKKQELNDAFYYFNVPAEVQHVTEGPSVTRFELAVEKGVKVSRITALQDDIKMALAAKDIRIEAPIPGTSLVGIEVPNLNPTKVNLKSILESPKFKNAESKLTVAMGNRINNEPLLMDIAKTPHALIAGATGSGKSVCINSILMSLLYKNHPEELRLLLIDPKMVELAPYNDLPHLVSPVITDVKAATQSLKWAVDEMEKRYKLFAQFHVRNITAFNKKAPYEQRMPKIVIVIDELADLMMMAPQEVEQSIARIAQKARACGIHMLVATQRPSVNVITGLIKANIPTRIAFMVSSSVDSRTILDSGGAERLLGYGDMLYLGSGMNKPIRVQGTFVSDDEIDDVVDFIKEQREPNYLFEEKELLKKNQTQAQDELFDDVCEFMVKEGHISTSLIQRHFQIGYNRAARIVDQLEQLDYISGANGSKPRDVFITEADLKKD